MKFDSYRYYTDFELQQEYIDILLDLNQAQYKKHYKLASELNTRLACVEYEASKRGFEPNRQRMMLEEYYG